MKNMTTEVPSKWQARMKMDHFECDGWLNVCINGDGLDAVPSAFVFTTYTDSTAAPGAKMWVLDDIDNPGTMVRPFAFLVFPLWCWLTTMCHRVQSLPPVADQPPAVTMFHGWLPLAVGCPPVICYGKPSSCLTYVHPLLTRQLLYPATQLLCPAAQLPSSNLPVANRAAA